MSSKSLDINQSIDWLNRGNILAHPTEGVWGLGCNAFDELAFKKIYDLKKRDRKKSFILLVNSYQSIEKYITKISKSDIDYLNEYWPGPVTFLIQYNNNLPEHLQNKTGKIAVRVSNHLPIKALIKGFNGIMVSTSANISGEAIINDPEKIMLTFDDDCTAFYNEDLGKLKKPSKIIDLTSRAIIRN